MTGDTVVIILTGNYLVKLFGSIIKIDAQIRVFSL
jgi:hypothetical protein